MNDDSTNWLSLYENMHDGKVDFNPKFYMTDTSQEGNGDIKLVTPTQAQVDQARVQLKRKISAVTEVCPKRSRKCGKKKTQTGGKRGPKKGLRGVKKSQRGGKRGKRVVKKTKKRVAKRGRVKGRKRAKK